jgi:glycerol-3-phosphate cytidylyltransferase
VSIVGYCPGVFDMFHVGHLNMLRRARAECDRLIAGVVTDDVVERVKGRRPVMPHDERVEIISSIRYVDQVVTDEFEDKFEMWKLLQFDVLFKGDDWKGTPKGDRLEAALGSVGSQVVYFPYTRQTSSTILRAFVAGSS